MLKQPLKALVLLLLWGSLVEDAILFVLAWTAPGLWFQLFHHASPLDLDVALLRRAAGQWAAFALVQAIALGCFRTQPLWLIVVAGARASDLFTDLSYMAAVPQLTTLGWSALLPPPLLNAIYIVVMGLAYRRLATPPAPPDLPEHR